MKNNKKKLTAALLASASAAPFIALAATNEKRVHLDQAIFNKSSNKKIASSFVTKQRTSFSQSFKTKIINGFKDYTFEETNLNYMPRQILEDSTGGLWAMIPGAKVHKFNYNSDKWEVAPAALSIANGAGGIIYEDSRNNLWFTATNNILFQYNLATKKWIQHTKALTGSKITDGNGAAIIEDKEGNLWAMGKGSKLQKYNYSTRKWTEQTSNRNTSSGSNITNGEHGFFFVDSKGNLWSMGAKTSLQRYDYEQQQWSEKLSASKLADGVGGKMFEDSRGDLYVFTNWVYPNPNKIWKYSYESDRWTEITISDWKNGLFGFILEDLQGNLWASSYGSNLKKYDIKTKIWASVPESNMISDKAKGGTKGVAFQDSHGSIFFAGTNKELQRYNPKDNSWNTFANIKLATAYTQPRGTIFEDSRGNLWMGVIKNNSKKTLRLTPRPINDPNFYKLKNFDITLRTRLNADSTISIFIQGYQEFRSKRYTHLQYKVKGEPVSKWKIVKNRIITLDLENYEFKWVLGTSEISEYNSNLYSKIEIKRDGTISSIIEDEIAKFKDFDSYDSVNASITNLPAGDNDVKDQFAAIKGYEIPQLASDVAISQVVVKEAFNPATRQMVFEIIFERNSQKLTKKANLRVTFLPNSLATEINKFIDFQSLESVESKVATFKHKTKNVKVLFESIAGYKTPSLASGFLVKKVNLKKFLDPITKKAVYTVTLANNSGDIARKDVVVTFLSKVGANEIKKINDFNSLDSITSSAAALPKSQNDVKNEFKSINNFDFLPALIDGFAISKVVVKKPLTRLSEAKSQVIYSVELAQSGKFVARKDVAVKFLASQIKTEVDKINDFRSSDNANSSVTNLEANSEVNVKSAFEAISDNPNPSLANRVTISKVIVKEKFNYYNSQMTFTVYFQKNGILVAKKDIVVSFETIDLSNEINKFKSFITTDKIGAVVTRLSKGDTNVKSSFETIHGFTLTNALSKGVSITKVVVKKDLDISSREMTFEVTLSYGHKTKSVDVVVTFAPSNLVDEANKFTDFVAIFDVELNGMPSGNTNVKDKFETLSGYSKPATLAQDVQIIQIVIKKAFNTSTRKMTFELTIQNISSIPIKKEIVVTFASDIDRVIAKFGDFRFYNTNVSESDIFYEPSLKLLKNLWGDRPYPIIPSDIRAWVSRKSYASSGTSVKNGNSFDFWYMFINLKNKIGKRTKLIKVEISKPQSPILRNEMAKVPNFSSVDNLQSIRAKFPKSDKNVKSHFESIGGFYSLPALKNEVSITNVVVKKPFNPQTKKIVFQLTFTKDTANAYKDIEVTFKSSFAATQKFNKIFNKITNWSSSYDIGSSYAKLPNNKQNFKEEFKSLISKKVLQHLSANNLLIKKVVVKKPLNKLTRNVVFAVTFFKDNASFEKDITVNFLENRYNLENDLYKFQNFVTTDDFSSSAASLPISKINNVKTTFEGIANYNLPILSQDIIVSKVTVKDKNKTQRQVTYIVTITNPLGEQKSKDVIVTFASNIEDEKEKFTNFNSIDGSTSIAAILPENNDNVQQQFETITGYKKPLLAFDVSLAKVVVKTALNLTTRQVVYELTLTKGLTTTTKEVTVTFASAKFITEAKKIIDFTSTDSITSSNANLPLDGQNIKSNFESINGFRSLDTLASGFSISEVKVKKVLNPLTRKVIFEVTILKDDYSFVKDIIVTFTSNDSVTTEYDFTQKFKTKIVAGFKDYNFKATNLKKKPHQIFEDSNGGLWAMIRGAKVHKFNYETDLWEEAPSELGINIGNGGIIYEDSRKNVWFIGGKNTFFQHNLIAKTWLHHTQATTGSNINNGYRSAIFEDSRGNLWSMGKGTPLQKYNYETKRWTVEASDPNTSTGSNITNGEGGFFFEDSRGNFWSMGKETKLQKYNYQTSKWQVDTSSTALKGNGAFMFEDSRGNLYLGAWRDSAKKISLQKYDYSSNTWINVDGINFISGFKGFMFEDSRGNLWLGSAERPLQKYTLATTSWGAAMGSNMEDGTTHGGFAFQDSHGKIFFSGSNKENQIYYPKANAWVTMTNLKSTNSGWGDIEGSIFEDSRGNLWLGAYNDGEDQILRLAPEPIIDPNFYTKKDFDITFRTRINSDGKMAILIQGYQGFKSFKYTHLQYKRKSDSESKWKIVKNKIIVLNQANYEFKWVLGTSEISKSNSNLYSKIEIKRNGVISSIVEDEIAKFNDFESYDSLNSAITSLRVNGENIKTKFEAIKGYENPQLANDITISKVKVKEAFNSATRQMVFEIIFTRNDQELAKKANVRVTFAPQELATEIEKFIDFQSLDGIKHPVSLIFDKTKDVKDLFQNIEGYNAPKLAPVVSIHKVNVKNTIDPFTKRMIFTVILVNNDDIAIKKDIIVTFINRLIYQEVSKIKDFTSSDNENSAAATLPSNLNNVKNQFENIDNFDSLLALANGVSISKVIVKTALDVATNKVVYTVEFSKADQVVARKDIAVTFYRSFWKTEMDKMKNFDSTDDANVPQVELEVNDEIDVKNQFESIGGYRAPTFNNNVIINKVVVKNAFNLATSQMTFTVYFSFNNEIIGNKDIIVTFAKSTLANEISKFTNFISSDKIGAAITRLTKSDADIKTQFKAIDGFAVPSGLAKDVSIRKVIIKKALNVASRQMNFTLTLSNGSQTANKEVIVTFTPSNLLDEASKFSDFGAVFDVTLTGMASSDTNVKDKFEELLGYNRPTNLAQDVKITQIVIKKAFKPRTKKMSFMLTLQNTSSSTIKKEIIVTFASNLNLEISKIPKTFNQYFPVSLKTKLDNVASTNREFKDDFISLWGNNFALASDVQIISILLLQQNSKTYSFIVKAQNEIGVKTRTIKINYSSNTFLDSEYDKIGDFHSLDSIDSVAAKLPQNDDNIKSQFENIGEFKNLPNLENSVSIDSVKVKKALNTITREMVFQITFSHKSLTINKDVVVTFTPKGFTAEYKQQISEFSKFDTYYSTNSVYAKLPKSDDDVKNSFKQLIEQDILDQLQANNITINKVIVKKALNANTREVIFNVQFSKNNFKLKKDVTITFAKVNLEEEITKFKNFFSTDDSKSPAAILAQDNNINVKDIFEKITGYDSPVLPSGVIVNQVVVKSSINDFNEVIFAITISSHLGEEATKDVVVTFVSNLELEKAKLLDFTSLDSVTSRAATLIVSSANIKNTFLAISGFQLPELAFDVAISKVVTKAALTSNQVTYTVTLTNYHAEATKDVRVTFATTQFVAEIAKISNFSSQENVSSRGATLPQTTSDVKATFTSIKGFSSLEALKNGVSIDRVVVKKALNPITRKVTFRVFLKKGSFRVSKDVVVTFRANLQIEANKFKDFNSSDYNNTPAAILQKNDTNVKPQFESISGHRLPQLSNGVAISKVVVHKALNDENKITYRLTIVELGGSSITKDVVVTFEHDINFEANKFRDFSSLDKTNSIDAILKTNNNNVKTTFEGIAGYVAPKLSSGISISKVVVHKALNSENKVTFRVTLIGPNGTTQSKDVIVTFNALDIQLELNKFNDFYSTDKTNSTTATLRANNNDVKTAFVRIAGYVAPKLSSGISISKVIVHKALNSKNKVTFKITLSRPNGTTATKDVEVTFTRASQAITKATNPETKTIKKETKSGLSTGVLVGIIIGSSAIVGIIGFLIYHFLIRAKQPTSKSPKK